MALYTEVQALKYVTCLQMLVQDWNVAYCELFRKKVCRK